MISFIFPTHVVDGENLEIQRECFESFLKFTPQLEGHEIIVIDNGSIPAAQEMGKNFATEYIYADKALGFAKAVNMGLGLAHGNIIGVLNNDLTFTKDWIVNLLKPLHDGRADIVAPATQAFEGLNKEVWSSCFFAESKTINQIGFFDDKLLPYRYHDQDYWIRAKIKGYRFRRVGDSLVTHRESTTFNKLPQREDHIISEEATMKKRWGVVMADQFELQP